MKKYSIVLIILTLVFSNINTVNSQSIEDGLVAYYPFNSNAKDESGNGNNGRVFGATLTSDRFGNANSAYSFDGVNDYISIGSSFTLGAAYSQYSVSVWFRSTSNKSNKIITDYYGVASGDEQFACEIVLRDTEIETGCRNRNIIPPLCYETRSNQNGLNDNQWHSVVYIMDGSSHLSVFIDGKLDHQTAYNPGVNYYQLPIWKIGASFLGGKLTSFFNGTIDDIRIYNRAISGQEVLELYNESKTLIEIYSLDGKPLFSDYADKINVSILSNGLYFLRVNNSYGKFIKQ